MHVVAENQRYIGCFLQPMMPCQSPAGVRNGVGLSAVTLQLAVAVRGKARFGARHAASKQWGHSIRAVAGLPLDNSSPLGQLGAGYRFHRPNLIPSHPHPSPTYLLDIIRKLHYCR